MAAKGSAEEAFPAKSLFCLSLSNPIRRVAIKIITNKWFERFSIFIIVVNSITLGLVDPCDVKCRRPLCAMLQVVEDCIFTFFALEMLLKMTAMGIAGRKAYLDDSWNRFDFFIVIVGTVEYAFADQEINLSAIRAIRVLRPLRAINRISSLRLLVTLLLDILPMLGNVMIFCFFIFFVFGIISVQLWAGMLRHRCFFPLEITSSYNPKHPPPFMPPFYRQPHREYVCSPSIGTLHCNSIPSFEEHNSMCADLFSSDQNKLTLCRMWVANYTDCRPDGPNPARGTINFDNIGYAWIAIFQVISLESWTEVMYLVQDSFSFWVWVFFISLVLVGSYLAVNLCLVVIATQFSETKMRENERMKRERMEELNEAAGSLQGSLASLISTDGLYEQLINLIYHYCRVMMRKVFRKKAKAQCLNQMVVAIQKSSDLQCPACRYRKALLKQGRLPQRAARTQCVMCGYNPAADIEMRRKSTIERRALWRRYLDRFFDMVEASRLWLRLLLEHDVCVAAVMGTIVVNAIVMAAEHHNQPQELTAFIETMNLVFTFIFVLELIIKLYAYGFEKFIREAFNLLDAIVIIINIAELFSSDGGPAGSGFAVLRLFRLVRIVKIIRFLPALQKQLFVMFAVVDHVATFFLLLGFFLFISSLLGMSLFGCKFCETSPAKAAGNPSNETCLLEVMSFEQEATRQLPTPTTTDPVVVPGTDPEDGYFGCSVANFDSPFQSIFTVLQVFTQDDWGAVMQDGMHFTSQWAGIYFVALVTIGNYIIFNLLVAILVEGFSSKSNEQQHDQKKVLEIINKRRNTLRRQTTVPETDAELTEAIKQLVGLEDEAFENPDSSTEESPEKKKKEKDEASTNPRLARCRDASRRCWAAEVSDRSLFIFRKDGFPRRQLRGIFNSVSYDKVLLVVIFGSCSLIVLERPSIDSHGLERRLLTIANYIFTIIFICEAFAKIIAYGFCLGRKTYLRCGWNVLDFFLVIISFVDISLDFTHASPANISLLQALRVLRLIRALRPLRIISRSPGLQIVLQTLMVSVIPIGNIILICCFFFLIFAILGVQLFSGCYARCLAPRAALVNATTMLSESETYSEWAMEVLSKVKTKNDCLTLGLQWETDSYNFNSLPEALMALFVFATLDGWTDITRNGVDCVGADIQPVRDYNKWAYGYFISFLLIVCFFALNMFVGVVVNNFQNVQRQVTQHVAMAKQGSTVKSFVNQIAGQFPKPKPVDPQKAMEMKAVDYPPWRKKLFLFVTHKYFEYAVIGAKVINVMMMTAEFYQMPPLMQSIITIASYVFLALLAVEVSLKMVAFGPGFYIDDRWNQIDVAIVILSVVGIILEELPKDAVPVNPAIVTFPRVFRIVRILKLLKSASGVRQLLETLSQAIPQVLNLSLLFFLLFFVYASLGVELYGRFDCTFEVCEGLSRHANFQNFGMSLLTLFRIFTGDNWNGILKDVLWMSQDPEECSSNHNDPESSGGLPCNVIHFISPTYFVSFVLLAQFVLINVVVAVLMSQLEDSHKKIEVEENYKGSVSEARNQSYPRLDDDIAEIEEEGCIFIKDSLEMAEIANHSNAQSSIEFYEEIPEPINVVTSAAVIEADAISVASMEYVLQHHDICDAEYLALKLRNLTLDSDSAVVSDITMSPLTSPTGSPVRITFRGMVNGAPQGPFHFSTMESRQNFVFKSPRPSIDLIDERTPRAISPFSRSFSTTVVSATVETRRAKFASRLPVVPESPNSKDKDHHS